MLNQALQSFLGTVENDTSHGSQCVSIANATERCDGSHSVSIVGKGLMIYGHTNSHVSHKMGTLHPLYSRQLLLST